MLTSGGTMRPQKRAPNAADSAWFVSLADQENEDRVLFYELSNMIPSVRTVW